MHDLDMTRRAGYIGGVFPTYKNYSEELWNVKPKEYSAYVQDKMEYAGLIINLGLRLDGLDLGGGDFANFFAPFTEATDAAGGLVRVPVRGENAPIKWFFSPRLGVSHPISDNAAMYFSFSRQQQSQPFSKLYTNYADFGNPSLPVEVRTNQDPIRSTNYDLGVQWAFIEGYGLDINAYYKDIQSYGGTGLVITPKAPWRSYNINTEFGYADSRGIEVTLRKNTDSGHRLPDHRRADLLCIQLREAVRLCRRERDGVLNRCRRQCKVRWSDSRGTISSTGTPSSGTCWVATALSLAATIARTGSRTTSSCGSRTNLRFPASEHSRAGSSSR